MNTERKEYICENLDEYKELLSSFVATKAYAKIKEHNLNENQAWKLMEWAINYAINLYEKRETLNYYVMDLDFEKYIIENLA